jgi:hypothetical protein
MAALTEELERRAPATAYVSLIADGTARFLYEKFGFADTAAHESIGMYRVMGGGTGASGPRVWSGKEASQRRLTWHPLDRWRRTTLRSHS